MPLLQYTLLHCTHYLNIIPAHSAMPSSQLPHRGSPSQLHLACAPPQWGNGDNVRFARFNRGLRQGLRAAPADNSDAFFYATCTAFSLSHPSHRYPERHLGQIDPGMLYFDAQLAPPCSLDAQSLPTRTHPRHPSSIHPRRWRRFTVPTLAEVTAKEDGVASAAAGPSGSGATMLLATALVPLVWQTTA